MIDRFKIERVFEDLHDGSMDEYDAKSNLKRMVSGSCVNGTIDRLCRDVGYGWKDVYDATRELERENRLCERRKEDAEREEREYWGMG